MLLIFILILVFQNSQGCPCENGGTCAGNSQCLCLAHFTGSQCETALFVKPSAGGLCSYHIQPLSITQKYQARDKCVQAGGYLANVDSAEKQEGIENVFFDSYGDSMTVKLHMNVKSFTFLENNRRVNFFPDNNFFPRWGWFQFPFSLESKYLTNSPHTWYPGINNLGKLYWTVTDYGQMGYVCEKHDTGVCTENLCNGYPCVNSGCTYKCDCPQFSTLTLECLETSTICNNEYCKNFGNCEQNGPDAICDCRHGFGGVACEDVIYHQDEEQKDACEYQVQVWGEYETFSSSENFCQQYGGDIATIRNQHQLKAVENIARKAYDRIYIIVWITGVKRDDGKFELPDGHLLDDISTDDFPRWGSNQPSSNPSETRLQLTTIPSYSPNGSNSDKLFYFRTADPSSKAGYICEKPGLNSAPPCSSTPCKNGGTCEESGCSFYCTCLSLFTGYNCADCVNPTPCDNTSCNGRGVCTRVGCIQNYTCDCDYGWDGDDCQTCILTPCDSNPCLNGATCENAADCSGNYDCICEGGYTGKNCETCMYDPCVSDPCLNNGECYMANNCSQQYSCSCIPFYKGLSCETRNFVVGEDTDECAYFADMNVGSGDFSSVNSFCESLNSSLAMIKTMFQQQYIIELILESYSEEVLSFWIGGQFKKSEWLWLDNNKIEAVNSDGFPRWGLFQPSINEIETGILLSNSLKFSSELGMETRPLVWASNRNYLKNGFVCERKVSGYHKCGSYPCINGGKCVEIGCSYRCVCLKGFAGIQCEYMYPRLMSSTPKFIPFSTNFSLSCTVEGIGLPSVTWKVRKSIDNKDEIIDQFKDEGSPFTIATEYNYNYVVSTFTVTKIGFCFIGASVTCWATNNVQKIPLILKSFSMKSNYFLAINDSYYIFSDKHLYTKLEAENECKEKNGELAMVSNEIVSEKVSNSINEKVVNQTWITNNAWIGLQKDNNKLWSDLNDSSYLNWASNEPKDNNSCVYISLESKWKTHSCIDDNFKAHYICEIKNRGVPYIERVMTPVGVGGKSSVVVEFFPHANMLDVTHTLRATSVSNNSGSNHTEFIKVLLNDYHLKTDKVIHTINNLLPEEKYTVTVSISPEVCSVPIEHEKTVQTEIASVAYLTLNNKTCYLRWVFSDEQLTRIQYFILNITKLPYSYASQRKELAFKKMKEESQFVKQSTNIDSYEFDALPNRINHVEIIGRKTDGKELILIPEGKCELKPEAPPKLDPPIINNNLFDIPSVRLNLADEPNGPISCYFLIATSYDKKPEEGIKIQISQEFMNRANFYSAQPLTGVPYIAMAVPKTENLTSIDFLIGNEKNTSCNIFNTKPQNSTSNVKKRSVDSNIIEYEAHNIPLVSFKYYSFALVTSTTTEDDDVLFESSQTQVLYINMYKNILFYFSLGALTLFTAVAMTAVSLKFAVRAKQVKKYTTKILPYFPVPDFKFDSIKNENKVITINPKRITKLKKLKEVKLFEDWLVELAPTLTTSHATEAFAKVVKGASLSGRQRQDFAMEIEIIRRFTNHASLVQLYGVCFDIKETSIIMERCPCGSLLDHLRQMKPGNNAHYFVNFAVQIAEGLQHLQKTHIVHRSLSCAKIFLSTHSNCKIGDFSHARVLNRKDGKYSIPDINVTKHEDRWMAPEAYHKHVFTTASDIWSFGIVMWEIFSYGEVPFKDIKDKDLERNMMSKNKRLSIPSDCPFNIYELMQECWNVVPMFRPSANKLKCKLKDFANTIFVEPNKKEGRGLHLKTETKIKTEAESKNKEDNGLHLNSESEAESEYETDLR